MMLFVVGGHVRLPTTVLVPQFFEVNMGYTAGLRAWFFSRRACRVGGVAIYRMLEGRFQGRFI